jgi:ferredoxin-NAD(P)+ reductase (naphthalene dioxygenase ferredoxin-specific)
MAGRCGVCRCTILQGQVLSTNGEVLQPGIGDGNEILACQSTLTSTCSIEVPEPDEVVTYPAKIIKATVVEIEQQTHDIVAIFLRPAKPIGFAPGQYATLQFTPDHIRPYSMAGNENDELLEYHIRLVPGGRVSPYVFKNLKVGDSVRISGPLGASYLRTKNTDPMLCVAGGTGLSPALSIIRGAIAAGMRNEIHLYFGVRTLSDLYYSELLFGLAKEHPQVNVQFVIANGDAPEGYRKHDRAHKSNIK